jgi:hypothetical protein
MADNELNLSVTSEDIREESIHFFIPMDEECLTKALKESEGGKTKDNDPKSWKIGGYASSSDTDLEGESVDPYGIDVSYFLKHGFFNSDHQKGPAHKVGIPTEAFVDSKGLYVRGYLLKDIEEARGIYKLMQALAKGEHDRQVGFSIEGKVIEQQGGRILKCWVKDIAITANPVNTKTYAELIKSLKEKNTSILPNPDLTKNSAVEKATDNALPGGKADNKSDESFDQDALEQGIKVEMEHTNDREVAKEIAKDHLTEDPRYYDALAEMEHRLEETKTVDKGLVAGQDTGNGGPSGQQTGGDALRVQDLDRKLKVTTNSDKPEEDEELIAYTMKKSGIEDIESIKKIILYATLRKSREPK